MFCVRFFSALSRIVRRSGRQRLGAGLGDAKQDVALVGWQNPELSQRAPG